MIHVAAGQDVCGKRHEESRAASQWGPISGHALRLLRAGAHGARLGRGATGAAVVRAAAERHRAVVVRGCGAETDNCRVPPVAAVVDAAVRDSVLVAALRFRPREIQPVLQQMSLVGVPTVH